MALEWKAGGAELFIWSTNGRTWCAVWPQKDTSYAAWVSGPSGRQTSVHSTAHAAMDWCEAQMPGEAGDG